METNYEELFHNERAERIAHQTNANRIIEHNEMLLRANHNLSEATGAQWRVIEKQRATIREQAELISQYETALLRAEQTIRNLGNGFLTGDGKEIALNEAANIREALKASAK